MALIGAALLLLAGCAQLMNEQHATEGTSFDKNSQNALVVVGVTAMPINDTTSYLGFKAVWMARDFVSTAPRPKMFGAFFNVLEIPDNGRVKSQPAPVQYRVFEVPPGTYKLTTVTNGGTLGGKYIKSMLPKSEFTVQAGEAVYIGNFVFTSLPVTVRSMFIPLNDDYQGKVEMLGRDDAAARQMLARYAGASVVMQDR
jgi:hypothetical protein